MSAIFGIIYKTGKPVEQQLVGALHASIAHRATDGKGTWMDGNAAFGHCLLKVFPQQEFENQPQQHEGLTITADARLDNRPDLATWFGIDKQQLMVTPDSTLILLAYQRWGKDCVRHLEGEFAFAIWDRQNQTLFAATDHIGFRPFFYYDSSDVFIFCSEIKGVVAAKPLPNYFNEESLIEYFYRKGTPNITYNREIFALCGGNTLTLQGGQMAIGKYWNLESTGKYNFKKDEDWYDCTRELLYRAVEKRLNPNVPTGITLSGGLDSTSIACILSELLMKKNKPLYAFSSVLPLDYKGIEKDERHYIEIVGRHCPNIIQTYVEAPGVGPFSDLEEAFEIEETFSNPFFCMDRTLLNVAKIKSIRTLYTGYGGDHWISWKGKSVIHELIKRGCYNNAFSLIRQFSKNEQQSFWRIARTMYLYHMNIYKILREILKQNNTGGKLDVPLQNIFKIKYEGVIDEDQINDSELVKHFIESGKLGRIVSRQYNRNGFFEISPSTPLLDKDICELLRDLPLNLFVKGGYKRSLIKNVIKDIVPQIICERDDKLPYVPGFYSNLINDKIMAEYMTYDLESDIANYYIDKSAIDKCLSVVNGVSESRVYTKKACGILVQTKIINTALKYLHENKSILFDRIECV
jgi:asparagine synthase (glutamine-hydrolysing)